MKLKVQKEISNFPLNKVSETMLLTLYNRAYEAKRLNSFLHDPEAVRIFDSLDFDFVGYFGKKPRGGMASRAILFDQILKDLMN